MSELRQAPVFAIQTAMDGVAEMRHRLNVPMA